MDLENAGAEARFLIRERDGKFPARFDQIHANAGIGAVLNEIRVPRVNSTVERWVQTCRRELLDRTLLWNQRHLLHALREFEILRDTRRTHQAVHQAAPLRAMPEPLADPQHLARPEMRKHARVGGVVH